MIVTIVNVKIALSSKGRDSEGFGVSRSKGEMLTGSAFSSLTRHSFGYDFSATENVNTRTSSKASKRLCGM
jgi:hypothetical protein